MRNDAMTVGTAHGAFGDFSLSLLNALRVADIHGLGVAVKMVKVKCAWIVKSTINATSFRFVIADPIANAFRSDVGCGIDLLSIARLLQSVLTPLFSLLWAGLLSLWTCSALTKSGAILSKSFSLKLSQAMGAVVKQWGCIIVGFHGCIVLHPCKPDIFEMTYEVAE
jgi:hypothetical protein